MLITTGYVTTSTGKANQNEKVTLHHLLSCNLLRASVGGCTALLMQWQIIFLAAICAVLFATQPRLSIKESREKKSSDKNTVWLILAVSGLGQIISLLEWAYARHGYATVSFQITGAALLIGGTIFRLHAIRVLGKFFSATVQIKDKHQIIMSGPYRMLRHPSYTGAYIAMLGCAVFLQSYAGMLIFGAGMLYVYAQRIKAEEETLIAQFNGAYENYRSSTWKMFPMVW